VPAKAGGEGLQAAVGSLESKEDPDEPNQRSQAGQVRNKVGRRDQPGFWRRSWEQGWSRLALASCTAHKVRATPERWQCRRRSRVRGDKAAAVPGRDAAVGREEEA